MWSEKLRFNQKVAFITGASSGIGEALAKELANQGAQVVLTGRRLDRLATLGASLRTESLAISCDVTQSQSLKDAVEVSLQKFGKLDIVIANAGYAVTGDLNQLTIEDYRKQFETNVFGVLNTVYAGLEALKKSKGVLVIVGSVNGYVPIPGISAYTMSKFAIHGLAQSIRSELKPFGISVLLVVPGFVESEIRNIDNNGKAFVRSKQDPIPFWIYMPSDVAARKIVSAIAARRREKIITAHGNFAVWMKRHFPGFFVLLEYLGLREEAARKG